MKKLLYIPLIFSVALAHGQAEYELVELSKLNSSYNEFSARTFNDGVLYCSNKKNDLIVSYLNENNDEPLTQLWFAQRKSFGQYTSARPLKFSEIQRSDIGAFATAGTDTLYFTRSYPAQKGAVLGIFYAVMQNGEWQKPVAFAHNDPKHNLGHPALSADGNKIYFGADFEKGHGQSDLYVCEKVKGQWSAPANLGPRVNSKQQELFPFVHPDGSVYFSSNRSGGEGQLDIYRAVQNETGEYHIEHLNAPFNSTGNDYGYSISADNAHGYITTDREGNDDIFEFQMIRPGFSDCPELEKNSYCYTFYDAEYVPLDTLPIRYEWSMGDGTKVRSLEVDHCYAAPGKYQVELNIVDTLTGDLFFSQASYELEVKEIEQVYIESQDTAGLGVPVQLHGNYTHLPGFEIDTYHWYFQDGAYYEGPEINHTFNQTGQNTAVLGLRGKANENGVVPQVCVQKIIEIDEDWQENLMVSANASEFYSPEMTAADSGVYDYIQDSKDTIALDNAISNETIYRVEIATSKERLSPYDRFFDGVREAYDVYENFIPGDSIFSYAVGNESEICNTYPIYSYVKSINYNAAHVKAYLPDHVYDLDDFEHISEEDLNRAVFRSGSIYFEMDDAQITDEAHHTLNKILELLNTYPSLQLEVGAHTDNTGNASYNLVLSRKRAKSVIEYLVNNGINPVRLIGVGYGSEVPIGSNENEHGRKMNRRVEFKVVSDHSTSKADELR